ncbi:MAG: DeoR/GlpR transcriptional regulator [Pseudomonadota bacterium]|nr:DeoR/GlpR transcriptional regulator [Pseudomonadota bacterium]
MLNIAARENDRFPEVVLAAPHGDSRRLPAQVRHSLLVEATRKRGFLVVSDIAAEIGVSEMTIRRDLVELERGGVMIRTHGGAMLSEGATQDAVDREEPAFEARMRANEDAKRRIALCAVDLLQPRQTVALDIGSTTYLMATQLLDRPLKFFTGSLRTAGLLAQAGRDVHMPGGQIRGEEPAAWGPVAIAQFERYWFDIAFIGVSGVTSEGLFDYSLEDSELKRVYLRRSAFKVLLCDSSKFHRMSLVQITDFSAIDMLITEAAPPSDIALALNAANVKLRIAPNPDGGRIGADAQTTRT